jgi:hypothetical protein
MILYAQLAPRGRQQPTLCRLPPYSTCDDTSGLSLGRGSFTFPRGRWTAIRQQVWLNTPGRHDGGFRIWVNGEDVISANDVWYRDEMAIGLGTLTTDLNCSPPPPPPPRPVAPVTITVQQPITIPTLITQIQTRTETVNQPVPTTITTVASSTQQITLTSEITIPMTIPITVPVTADPEPTEDPAPDPTPDDGSGDADAEGFQLTFPVSTMPRTSPPPSPSLIPVARSTSSAGLKARYDNGQWRGINGYPGDSGYAQDQHQHLQNQ